MRYNFPNGWFVGSERGGMGLNGINRNAAFGNFGSLYTEGMQFGYSFKNASGLPVTVYAGFDTLKYNTGIGGPFAPFDSVSGTLPVYSAHAGVEFQADVESQPVTRGRLHPTVGAHRQRHQLALAARRFSVCLRRSPLTRAFQGTWDKRERAGAHPLSGVKQTCPDGPGSLLSRAVPLTASP